MSSRSFFPNFGQGLFPKIAGKGLAVLASEIAHDILKVSAQTGPHRAVGNVSVCRCVSDCKARGCQFYPGLVPCFRGD